MKHIGDAVLGALLELGEIEEAGHCRTEVESAEGLLIEISLKGGTMRDKTAFAACMRELWGVIDNPRYRQSQVPAGQRRQKSKGILRGARDLRKAEGAGARI